MKNLKYYGTVAIILLFLVAGCVISVQKKKIDKLKTQNAITTEMLKVHTNNETVLKENAQYWRTKDSINVVTVGLLSADKEMFKDRYEDLNTKFNNLIKDNSKNVTRTAYLESQVKIKDNLIAALSRITPRGPSYIKNDSTIVINDSMYVDARNYRNTSGNIVVGIDSNKISTANISLQTEQSIGIDLALYKDKSGIDRVSAGTKYPNANLSVNGIVDIEQKMKDYRTIAEAKNRKTGRIGIGLNLGYGFTIKDNTVVKAPYFGLGVSYSIIRLK